MKRSSLVGVTHKFFKHFFSLCLIKGQRREKVIFLLSFPYGLCYFTYLIPFLNSDSSITSDFPMLLRNSVLPSFSFYDFYFWNQGSTRLITPLVLSVFCHNADFLDIEWAILCRVRNDFSFPKGTILCNAALSLSVVRHRVFKAHPGGFTCSFIHVFPQPVWTPGSPGHWLAGSVISLL